MAKNKVNNKSGKWVEIADEDVRHVWVCNVEDCPARVDPPEVMVNPDFFKDGGTPVCQYCDTDMDYLRTEVKI